MPTDRAGARDAREAAGRIVIAGLDGAGLDKVETALVAGRLGGLILFREDLPTLVEGAELITRARALAPHPLLVGIDEEGGLVSQIDGVAAAPGSACSARGGPSPGALGEEGDVSFTGEVFREVGTLLRAVGIDIAFAPLLDVNVREENPVIGRRSFGALPEIVAAHGRAAIGGLQAAGILPTAKHFPGHGAAVADSHHTLPVIAGSRADVERRDLFPFRAALANVPLVMSAHVSVPALDPSPRPATLSCAILEGVLRGEMGYRGVVVSDALEMSGFATMGEPEELVPLALLAGVDVFLVARGAEHALRTQEILARAASRPEVARRLVEAAMRVESLVRASGRPERGACTRSRGELAAAMEEVTGPVSARLAAVHRRVTRTRPGGRVKGGSPLVLIASGDVPRAFLADEAILRAFARFAPRVVRYGPLGPDDGELPRTGTVVQLAFSRGSRRAAGDKEAARRVESWRLGAAGREAAVIAVADDHVLDALPEAWVKIVGSGSHLGALEAAAEALMGRRA